MNEQAFSSPPPAPAARRSGVRLEAVTKRFGPLVAVREVTLDVAAGEFFSLLGPSGCGKTTLLRMVGGFEQPDGGRILIGGQDVTRLTPQARPTGMVFQSYALFPTMTVAENVAYGLEVRKRSRSEIRERVAAALARVDLHGQEAKPVTQLSGGQQQRVALARALAVEPEVILFDEPLSNLDVALREQTRAELKQLQRQLGTTSLYVTHDQQEALALSDRIAVMRAGSLEQIGTPEGLYEAPETAFVARFLGGSNIVRTPALARALTPENGPTPDHVLAVRPEHLKLVDGEAPGAVRGRLLSRQFLGTHAEWWIETSGERLRAWMEPALPVPEALYLRAVRHRWVRDNPEPA